MPSEETIRFLPEGQTLWPTDFLRIRSSVREHFLPAFQIFLDDHRFSGQTRSLLFRPKQGQAGLNDGSLCGPSSIPVFGCGVVLIPHEETSERLVLVLVKKVEFLGPDKFSGRSTKSVIMRKGLKCKQISDQKTFWIYFELFVQKSPNPYSIRTLNLSFEGAVSVPEPGPDTCSNDRYQSS